MNNEPIFSNGIPSTADRLLAMEVARGRGRVGPEEFAAFFNALNARVTAHFLAEYPDCEANHYTLYFNLGTRFVKISKHTPGQSGGSAYAFIDRANGDILKPASWKAPAKHARGNIRIGTIKNWFNGAMNEISVTYLS